MKDISVNLKQYVFGLLIIVIYDLAKKTLCYLCLGDFNDFLIKYFSKFFMLVGLKH